MNGCQESLMSEDAPIVSPIISIEKEKRCTKCGETKLVEMFSFDKSKKDGRCSWCKDCSFKSANRWRLSNMERVRANNRNWKTINPEGYRRKFRKANKKRLETIDGQLNDRITRSMNRTLNGSKNRRAWTELTGYTLDDLKKHLEKQFKGGMDWNRFMAGEIHIDHKIPISAFNYEKPEDDDFKRCWSLKNLQPLWSTDNHIKKAKINKPFQPSLIF